MELQVRDRVIVIDEGGSPLAVGTVININEFREPSLKFCVDVDDYEGDYLFFGADRLVKEEAI